jgi:hypothetical protein
MAVAEHPSLPEGRRGHWDAPEDRGDIDVPEEILKCQQTLRAELDGLNAHLDQLLHVFADFEAALNDELKLTSDAAERAEIFERRAVYEQTLGIEDIVERIDMVRERLRGHG